MEAKNLNFSLFYDKSKGIETIKPKQAINFTRLIDIYNSELVKEISSKIKEADEQTKKELKKQLPFITPYGTFNPTRANINLTSFNGFLLCLDIDGLKENEVQLVKFILTSNHSTLLCAISPRGLGVKALILIDDRIPQHECYNTLKLNKNHIAQSLGLEQFVNKIDNSQFKPTQPWFISYDPRIYVYQNATPLRIDLIPYIEPEIVNEPINFNLIHLAEKSNFQQPINFRIEKYFENSVNHLLKFFACCVDGQRHSNIIKVQTVASWLHYAPQLEPEIKSKLYNACCSMYGSEKEAIANNVHKSFERAWKSAPIKQNRTIEAILSDTKYNVSINELIQKRL